MSLRDYVSNVLHAMAFGAWIAYESLRGTQVKWHISGANADTGTILKMSGSFALPVTDVVIVTDHQE